MKVSIPKYVHRCWPDEGEPFCKSVDEYEYEYGQKCESCGELLATTEQIVAHIYSQLTED